MQFLQYLLEHCPDQLIPYVSYYLQQVSYLRLMSKFLFLILIFALCVFISVEA